MFDCCFKVSLSVMNSKMKVATHSNIWGETHRIGHPLCEGHNKSSNGCQMLQKRQTLWKFTTDENIIRSQSCIKIFIGWEVLVCQCLGVDHMDFFLYKGNCGQILIQEKITNSSNDLAILC